MHVHLFQKESRKTYNKTVLESVESTCSISTIHREEITRDKSHLHVSPFFNETVDFV